jgi:hypothetical protein
MKGKIYINIGAIAAVAFWISACVKNAPISCLCSPDNLTVTSSVFSTGFNNPRGIKFGPDGYLYVAEGGTGGKNSTTTCAQVIPRVGPYTGSQDGSRISRVGLDGTRYTFIEGLPSDQTAITAGSEVSGVADLAFVDNTLYGVLAGAGCSHGVTGIPNGIFRVNRDRSWEIISDLSAFWTNNPVANPSPSDFEPDGSPYSMNNVDGDLFVVEANHGELDRISRNGNVSRVVDFSATLGHIVPACQTFHDGNFYIGNEDTYPIMNKSAVYKITPGGDISTVASNFSTVLGILFDEAGGMYVLESTTGHPMPTPGTGDIIRIDPSGEKMTIASGLNFPTAMTFGPDHKLYVSIWGFGGTPGQGEIWQFDISCIKQYYHTIRK